LRWRRIAHRFRDEFGGFTPPEEAGDDLWSLVVPRNRIPMPSAWRLANRRCV
jgi:hypothetical protein